MFPLPDHRLDHRVGRLQLLGHVVLLDQPLHDALMGGRAQVMLGPAQTSGSVWVWLATGDLLEVLLHRGDVGLQLVVEPWLFDGFLQVIVEEERVEDDLG